MKTKILIIEDNDYKSFTTKQVLEAQLHLSVSKVDAASSCELLDLATTFAPDVVIYCPEGGVLDLLEMMKKRNANRRNTEVRMIVTDELETEACRVVQLKLSALSGTRLTRPAIALEQAA